LKTALEEMDLATLRNPTALVATLVARSIAILGKFIGAYAGARLSRMGHWAGIALGARHERHVAGRECYSPPRLWRARTSLTPTIPRPR
jgi:hypothetical protein